MRRWWPDVRSGQQRAQLVERLDAMPGVSRVVAPALVAEVGLDMTRVPTHHHLLSWACLCPRLDQSAGRVHSTRTRKGATWLKTMLVQAAWAAVKCRKSCLRAQFLRIKSRRGPKKAIVAVAASMLTAVYFMIRDGVQYHDLGPAHFGGLDRAKVANPSSTASSPSATRPGWSPRRSVSF